MVIKNDSSNLVSKANWNNWVSIAFVNLLIVAMLGVLMRFKIGFELPLFDQKNLQLSHSHFAFSGWISLMLMVLMVRVLDSELTIQKRSRFILILKLQLTCAYAMLASFIYQGYGPLSIAASTVSILLFFYFAYWYLKAIGKANKESYKKWFTAAIIFNMLSSFGTAYLSYMMYNKHIEQHQYLCSVYWFLHFHYNGWFFFACGGLLSEYISRKGLSIKALNQVFYIMVCSCVPAYGLSILWLKLPLVIQLLTGVTALLQVATIPILILFVKKSAKTLTRQTQLSRFLWIFILVAYSIKIILQACSTFPDISHLAFGFRPIVVAYLHLVLLAFTSVYLLTYCWVSGLVPSNFYTRVGLMIFVGGVFMNEIFLAIQGILGITYIVVPYINTFLFIVAAIMFFGLLLFNGGNLITASRKKM